jgi:membrane-bound lytic murein transglycosylase D
MKAPRARHEKPTPAKRSRAVTVRVLRGKSAEAMKRFTGTFTIGRGADCGLQIFDDAVALRHVQILFDGVLWWVRDLNSGVGTYVGGTRAQVVPLPASARIELGKGGPLLALDLADEEEQPVAIPADSPVATATSVPLKSETQIFEKYIGPLGDEPVGAQTMMIRKAFERVRKKSSWRYRVVIGAFLVALVGAAGVIAYQRHKLQTLRATAEKLFYTMKSIELQTAKLLKYADPQQVTEIAKSRAKLKQMESEYDSFVGELGIYGKVPEDERYILHMARRFGEYEVNTPKEFVAEVKRYIERWRSTERLGNSLKKIKQKGWGPAIGKAFSERDLPRQFLYLALVESNFDERAVGPPTRYGFAKGMWQFISLTGDNYGLRIGPLFDQAVYDPQDERFDWEKATVAAAKYIHELHSTDAQASGLLVMASYNWDERKIRKVLASMPESPQERNFWRLLAYQKIPIETYDYVLSIFSAAVICENPRLFGVDVECPLGSEAPLGIDERGRARSRHEAD